MKWSRNEPAGSPSEAADTPLTPADALLHKLRQARLFHYAGHADFVATGLWQHSLRTTDQAGVLVGDLLLLDHVPAMVSLFACNSGLSSEEVGGLEGLGLAQAFLLRGSQWVVGTVRNVDDRLAAAVSIEFYRRLTLDVSAAPYLMLHDAVEQVKKTFHVPDPLSLRGLRPDNDLSAFRIFVR